MLQVQATLHIQFVRFATLLPYLALYYCLLLNLCDLPYYIYILLFGTIHVLGTPEYWRYNNQEGSVSINSDQNYTHLKNNVLAKLVILVNFILTK